MKAKFRNARRFNSYKRRRSHKRSKHHEWKRSEKVKRTTNNKEYKIWRIHIEDPLACWYCSPHQGCNYHRDKRSYKSWKYCFRKRKQWMYAKTKNSFYI